jgi:hypothetical protein
LAEGVGGLTEGRTQYRVCGLFIEEKFPPMANPLRTKLRVGLRESSHQKLTPFANG